MIRFSKYIWVYILISSLVILPGIFSLFKWGFKQSIDFSGGTLLEINFEEKVSQESLEDLASANDLEFSSIQPSESNTYILRTKEENIEKITKYVSSLEIHATSGGEIVRQETVGPVLGKELLAKAITAAIFAIIVILSYVAYAFRNIRFGMAAIIALVHDLFVMLGTFSLLGHFLGIEVDTLYVTALLTTMSFSVHDTIVILDRIREYQRKGAGVDVSQLCDRALTETMGRSLTNSMTIIIMLVALVLMGGETIRWFAIALLVGTISGTYSSPFVATPSIIIWEKLANRKKKK
ncbi:protein translocase subunit SecF [Patescibacteria group bacterium]